MLSDADVSLFNALSQHIKDIKLIGQTVHGYVNTLKNFEELMVDLQLRTGVQFATRSSITNKRNELKVGPPLSKSELAYLTAVTETTITHSTRFLWQLKGKVGIPEQNSPFTSGKYFNKVCEYGKQYQTRPQMGKRRQKMSKKQDCVATLHVKEIILFPDYTVSKKSPNLTDYQKRMAKLTAVQELKRDLMAKKTVIRKYRYYVNIPLICVHNHECVVTPPLHPLILQKIDEMVFEGIHDRKVVSAEIRKYIDDELPYPKPSLNDPSFYPYPKDLSGYINVAKRKLQYLKSHHREEELEADYNSDHNENDDNEGKSSTPIRIEVVEGTDKEDLIEVETEDVDEDDDDFDEEEIRNVPEENPLAAELRIQLDKARILTYHCNDYNVLEGCLNSLKTINSVMVDSAKSLSEQADATTAPEPEEVVVCKPEVMDMLKSLMPSPSKKPRLHVEQDGDQFYIVDGFYDDDDIDDENYELEFVNT